MIIDKIVICIDEVSLMLYIAARVTTLSWHFKERIQWYMDTYVRMNMLSKVI